MRPAIRVRLSTTARPTSISAVWAAAGRGFSINRCGQVAGWALTAAEVPHAFFYDGTVHDLGTLGGVDSYGYAITTCGRVAGWAATATGETHAFYRDSAGMRDPGTSGGTGSYAQAINSLGQVVGYAYGPGNAWFHAFLYDARTGAPIRDLGTPGENSLAQDINASGRVVGYVYFPDNSRVAFLHDGTTLRSLGSLGGSRFSDAVAINTGGLVVGSSLAPADGEHAVAWGVTYGLVDLNERAKDVPQGVVLVAALAVADDGAIVVRTNAGLGLLRPRK